MLSQYIKEFGAQAVLGRTLYAHEIFRITAVENILHAYRSEQKALNWATWAGENPKLAKMLREVRELIND